MCILRKHEYPVRFAFVEFADLRLQVAFVTSLPSMSASTAG